MKLHKHSLRFIYLVIAVFFLSSCALMEEQPYSASDPQLSFPYYPDRAASEHGDKDSSRVFPWEIWTPEKDLDGLPLVNFAILKGDELSAKGRRQEALKHYQSVDSRRLLPQEQEALVFRIASSQLSIGQAKDALNTLSDFFTQKRESADFVGPAFAILLGYTYGYNQNIDQSLAWFSRVNKINHGNRSYNLIAANGAKDFLSKIPADSFERTANAWSGDNFVRTLIAEERALRAQRGVVSQDPIWAQLPTVDTGTLSSGAINVATLLPLSGRFGFLGNSTKNGIELALSGATVPDRSNNQQTIEIINKDTVGEATILNNQLNELISGAVKPTVILGPLLAELAQTAGEAARQNRIPLITFSKKSGYATGGGVFRIGATAESQVESILAKTVDEMNLQRYALVYANDVNGQDFAYELKRQLARRNITPIYERMYTKDDFSSFLSIAQELERYPAQAVFFPDNLLSASRFFSSFAPQYLRSIKMIGTASWDDATQIARYNTILNGAIFVSPFFAGSQDENIKRFVSVYTERYNSQPDFLAAQGYDAGILVLRSLRDHISQGATFESAMLRQYDYQGLTGRISVSSNGEIKRRYALVEFIEGVIRELPSTVTGSNFVMRGNAAVSVGTPTY